MKRLLTTVRWDVTLQFRNGFYYAAAVVALIWVLLLPQVPRGNLAWLLPALILGNLLINTFYFVGGLLLLEKEEGTLTAQVVTPLKVSEYLGSKLLTLTLLSLLENGVIALLVYGFTLRLLPFALGLTLASLLFTLTGFLVVIRYDAINEYLLPSIGYVGLLLLPLFAYFGNWHHWLVYLHPVQPAFLLLQGGWISLSGWQWVYGIVYAVGFTAVVYRFSRHAFHYFVVAGEGKEA